MRHASPAYLSSIPETEAPRDCPLCPRLVALRQSCRAEHPDWWNAPVPAFGDPEAWLAIVGLAPGKHGANRTGRPFTGDFAGDLLYATLLKFGLARASMAVRPTMGCGSRARSSSTPSNACRRATSRSQKKSPIAALFGGSLGKLPNIRVLVALGQIAHVAAARALGIKPSAAKFTHGAEHVATGGRILLSSYHCSRLNQNTGRLDSVMFEAVFERALALRRPA
jgi:uracil-DNA glycosylase